VANLSIFGPDKAPLEAIAGYIITRKR